MESGKITVFAADRAARYDPRFGAVRHAGGVMFRVWAPAAQVLELVVDAGGARTTHPMTLSGDHFFEVSLPADDPGTRYWYRVDGDRLFPDPASRYQPDGPHGPSAFVD